MSDIVKIINNQATTTSLDIAKGTGNEHRAVLQLIKNHQKRFLKFGELISAFEMRKTQGRNTVVYQLNEAQATLLLTMMKNTPKVLDFKVALVEAFFRARALLQDSTMTLIHRHALLNAIRDNEKSKASDYGRGLAEWKIKKDALDVAIAYVEQQLQPELPFMENE